MSIQITFLRNFELHHEIKKLVINRTPTLINQSRNFIAKAIFASVFEIVILRRNIEINQITQLPGMLRPWPC